MAAFFTTVFIQPLINVLVVIYQVLLFLHIPYPLGFSIILLTIVIRFLLYPLTASQLKTSKKMQTLNPHLSRLKEQHKGDAKRIQEETMKLYKDHGVNPAAGCLPVLIQLPIIWSLYSVLGKIVGLSSTSIISYVNSMVYMDVLRLRHPWDTSFLGIPLGKSSADLISVVGPIVLIIPILTAVLQFVQSKMMVSSQPASPSTKSQDDFASAFQMQSLYIFPLMIGFFSYRFPVGLSLYWNTFTVFGILQQYKMQGFGGLEGWIEKARKLINT